VKPIELTRQVLLDQATNVFAEKGYEGASVREITRRADTKQASINYHFGTKASLYLEVLKLALSTLGDASLLDADTIEQSPREEAVCLFIRQQVTHSSTTDKLADIFVYLRGKP
jgi:AcrR family transcriptional regulator